MAPGSLEKWPPASSLIVRYFENRNYSPIPSNKDFLPRAAALSAELVIYYFLCEHPRDKCQAASFDPFMRFN